jgi:GGDEF domain-containing protein
VTVTVDDNRLRVLHSTELLDSPPEPSFDRLTRLASHVMGAPVALQQSGQIYRAIVLARADRRLYEAKQAGRNRVHPE